MAYTEADLYKLVLRYEGREELAAAEKAQDGLLETLRDLDAQLKAGTITQQQHAAAVRQTKDQLIAAGNAAETAEAKIRKAEAGTRNLGQAGLTAGRALQDFTQGGIGGILNNIEGLSVALGGGPGIAGLLTAVGVAAYIAKPYIAQLMESLSPERPKQFADAIAAVQEQIKKLEEKPTKLAIDLFELDQAKRRLAEMQADLDTFNRGLTKQTEREQATGRVVSDVMTEAPGGQAALEGKMASQMLQEFKASDKILAENLKRAEFIGQLIQQAEARIASGKFGAESDEEDRAQIEKNREQIQAIGNESATQILKLEEDAKRAVGRIMRAAQEGTGEAQRIAQEQLGERMGMAGMSPEFVAAMQGDIANAQVGVGRQAAIEAQGVAQGGAINRAAAKADRELTEALLKQGTENQLEGVKDASDQAKRDLAKSQREEEARNRINRAAAAKAMASEQTIIGASPAEMGMQAMMLQNKAMQESPLRQVRRQAVSDERMREILEERLARQLMMTGQDRDPLHAAAAAAEAVKRAQENLQQQIDKGMGQTFNIQVVQAALMEQFQQRMMAFDVQQRMLWTRFMGMARQGPRMRPQG